MRFDIILAGVGGQVDDRLAGVEALDEQHVHPRLVELAGLGRPGDVDAQHAVRCVGVVGHIEWAAMNAAAGYPPERGQGRAVRRDLRRPISTLDDVGFQARGESEPMSRGTTR